MMRLPLNLTLEDADILLTALRTIAQYPTPTNRAERKLYLRVARLREQLDYQQARTRSLN